MSQPLVCERQPDRATQPRVRSRVASSEPSRAMTSSGTCQEASSRTSVRVLTLLKQRLRLLLLTGVIGVHPRRAQPPPCAAWLLIHVSRAYHPMNDVP
jgi:hypothetical protein